MICIAVGSPRLGHRTGEREGQFPNRFFAPPVRYRTDSPPQTPHRASGVRVGAPAVAVYRMYRVAPGGRLLLGQAFDAEHDHAAVEQARALHQATHPAELWEGGRLIGRFSKLGLFTPGGG